MITLERIVRPFQTNDVTPPRRTVSVANPDAAENLVLVIGKNGSGKNLSGQYSWTMSRYMDKRYKEWFRANSL